MARKEKRDEMRRALRALLLLALFVGIGVFAAEAQLNALTLRSDFVRVANLRREDGQAWALYVLGARMLLTETGYPDLLWRDGVLTVALRPDWMLRLPVEAAAREGAHWTAVAQRTLRETYTVLEGELRQARRSAVVYAKELQEYLETF